MAPIVIVGAMIGAGVGGVISGRTSGSPWGGALLGAAGGALAGWGAGALGLGSGIASGGASGSLSSAGSAAAMQPMSGIASVGAAAPAASTVAPATSVLSSLSTNSPFTSTASSLAPAATTAAKTASTTGGLLSGIKTSDIITGGLGLGSTAASLLSTPSYPEETTTEVDTLEDDDDTGPTLRDLTAEELATRNARRKALANRYRDARIAEGAQSAAALAAIRRAYEDPRSYLRTAPNTLARRQGVLTGIGGFRFNTV